MKFDAWYSYDKVREKYIDFLLDLSMGAFSSIDQHSGWNQKRMQLKDLWEQGCPETGLDSLFADPLVEFSFPYKDDKIGNLDSLRAEGRPTESSPLHPQLVNLLKNTPMADWTFKEHQVEAFRKSVTHQTDSGETIKEKSIIISSGTGSGKTESFLIPMLNKMFWNEDEKSLEEPGIRALIIYPMNALVNNQLQRLNDILSEDIQSKIKYGFYTSRLKEQLTQKDINGMDESNRQLFSDSNFITDRKTLREKPPHILITNYSMLELMLIRPKDSSIFKNKLQTVILDEAHVYSGALGTDIALLLRRAADRFGKDMNSLNCIATSATMDNTQNAQKNLSSFGAQIFSKKDEEIICITGARQQLMKGAESFAGTLPLKSLSPEDCRWLLESDIESLSDGARLLRCLQESGVIGNDVVCPSTGFPEFLYDCFTNNTALSEFRKLHYNDGHPVPVKFSELKENLVGKEGDNLQAAALLSLFTKAFIEKDGAPYYFLPGKLHTFIRAPYKIYTDLVLTADYPLGRLYDTDKISTQVYPVYLSGNIRQDFYFHAKLLRDLGETGSGNFAILPPSSRKHGTKEVYFRFFDQSVDSAETLRFDLRCGDDCLRAEEERNGTFVFCRRTLDKSLDEAFESDEKFYTIDGKSITSGPLTDLEYDDMGEVTSVRLPSLGQISKDIIDSILAEALIPYLPVKNEQETAGGRGTLIFADNRQGAAWRATFIQDGYNKNVARNYIFRNILDNSQAESAIASVDQKTLDFLESTGQLEAYLKEMGGETVKKVCLSAVIDSLYASPAFRREIPLTPQLEQLTDQDDFWKSCVEALVHRELLLPNMQTRNLESMGFVRSVYPEAAVPKITAADTSYVNLVISNENFKSLWPHLISQIYDYMRMAGAIVYKTDSNELKNYKSPYTEILGKSGAALNKQYFLQLNVKENRQQMGFMTSINIRNFCRRVLKLCKIESEKEDVDKLLEYVFNLIAGCNHSLIHKLYVDSKPGLSLNPACFEFEALEENSKLEFHSEAYRLRKKRDEDLAESTNARTEGKYADLDVDQNNSFKNSRDYKLYTSGRLPGIRASEHTAQISPDQLKQIENGFNKGHINLLCCSTTMELGIDLDGLVSVVMGNLPPEPSNYIQRAGRAGRRNDSSSLVMTVLRQNPYDLSVFENSRLLYDKLMELGHIRFTDTRIIERHVFAYIITDFYKQCNVKNKTRSPLGSWSDLQGFFGSFSENLESDSKKVSSEALMADLKELPFFNDKCMSIYEVFLEYLNSVRGELDQGILNIIDGTVRAFTSPESLIKSLEAAIIKEYISYQKMMKKFKDQEQVCIDLGNERGVLALNYQKRQYLRQQLVTYLANELIIPRYGFPIDVIELQTRHIESDESSRYKGEGGELSRSLELALMQYSPGSEIIVNHQVYKSRGMTVDRYQPEESAIQKKYFIICKACGNFTHSDADISECPVCEHPTKNGLKAGLELELESISPTENKEFFLPRAFSIAYSEGPQSAGGYLKYDRTQNFSCVSINASDVHFQNLSDNGDLSLKYTYRQNHDLFFFNGGLHAAVRNNEVKGKGFCVCMNCGYTSQEKQYLGSLPDDFSSHKVLYGIDPCRAGSVARNVILGGTAKADVMVFRIPAAAFEGFDHQRLEIAETFKTALVQAGVSMLKGDSRILGSQLVHHGNCTDVILYDTSGSATGYIMELDSRQSELLANIESLLKCRKGKEDGLGQCETACYNCLLNYSSATDHKKLDRKQTRDWWTAASPNLIGAGLSFEGCKVQQGNITDRLFRYDTRDVLLRLDKISASSLSESDSLLHRLYLNSVRSPECNVRILLSSQALSKLSGLQARKVLSTLHTWSLNSNFEVRTVKELSEPGSLVGSINQVPVFAEGLLAADYTVESIYNDGSWYFGVSSPEADSLVSTLGEEWAVSNEIELPAEEASTVRILIPGEEVSDPEYLSRLVLGDTRLNLLEKMKGKKVRRIFYQDRYLVNLGSIRNLYYFLKSFPVTADTEIRLVTMATRYQRDSLYVRSVSELKNKYSYHDLNHINSSSSELIFAAEFLTESLKCSSTDILYLNNRAKSSYDYNNKLVAGWEGEQHGRQMVVEFEDGEGMVFLFDLGMSWARTELKSDNRDRHLPILDPRRRFITSRSYLHAATELSDSDRELWDLSTNIDPYYGEWLDV